MEQDFVRIVSCNEKSACIKNVCPRIIYLRHNTCFLYTSSVVWGKIKIGKQYMFTFTYFFHLSRRAPLKVSLLTNSVRCTWCAFARIAICYVNVYASMQKFIEIKYTSTYTCTKPCHNLSWLSNYPIRNILLYAVALILDNSSRLHICNIIGLIHNIFNSILCKYSM